MRKMRNCLTKKTSDKSTNFVHKNTEQCVGMDSQELLIKNKNIRCSGMCKEILYKVSL